jgi:hypothetical protein
MSGSGGGGGGGGGGGLPPSTPKFDCSTLFIKTTLNSPDPGIVKKLRKGQKLQVTAKALEGPVYAVTEEGKTAGSITDRQLHQLLQCIAEGFVYVAIVQAIAGGRVDVEVRPEAD